MVRTGQDLKVFKNLCGPVNTCIIFHTYTCTEALLCKGHHLHYYQQMGEFLSILVVNQLQENSKVVGNTIIIVVTRVFIQKNENYL